MRKFLPVLSLFAVTSAALAQTSPSDNGQDAAACGACGACGAIYLFVVAGFLVLNILMLVWVARDAKNRGMDTPAVWMLLVLFTSVVGLIVYLLSRPSGTFVLCPRCGNKKLPMTVKCPHCGNAA